MIYHQKHVIGIIGIVLIGIFLGLNSYYGLNYSCIPRGPDDYSCHIVVDIFDVLNILFYVFLIIGIIYLIKKRGNRNKF